MTAFTRDQYQPGHGQILVPHGFESNGEAWANGADTIKRLRFGTVVERFPRSRVQFFADAGEATYCDTTGKTGVFEPVAVCRRQYPVGPTGTLCHKSVQTVRERQ